MSQDCLSQIKFWVAFDVGYMIDGLHHTAVNNVPCGNEARILLIILNLVALFSRGLPFNLFGIGMTVFDVAGIGAALGMTGLLLSRAVRNLQVLGRLEPANVVRID